jgi:hypothetical protein
VRPLTRHDSAQWSQSSVTVSVISHCLGHQSLSRSSVTVSVISHCLGHQSLSQSSVTVSVIGHCLGHQSLSQSSATVSVISHCLSHQSLSQSSVTVSVISHCLSHQSLSQVSVTLPSVIVSVISQFQLSVTVSVSSHCLSHQSLSRSSVSMSDKCLISVRFSERLVIIAKHTSRLSLPYDFLCQSDRLSHFMLLLIIPVPRDHQIWNQNPQASLLFVFDRSLECYVFPFLKHTGWQSI